MKMYEYTNKAKFNTLSPDTQKFVAKTIMKEVKQIAEKKKISEMEAYAGYSKGLYDTDLE